MAIEQAIELAFTKAFKKYVYNEMVIGQLAVTETKRTAKFNDEVDVIMPPTVTLSDYAGGDLNTAEKVETSIAKVRIDRGKSVHFGIDKIKEEFLKNSSAEKQAELIKDYTQDAIKQFAAAVDTAYGKLYTRAGITLDNNGSAITLSASNCKDILAYMQAKFKEGDGKGHTSWVDGEMACILPPAYQFYLGKLDVLKYVESGAKDIRKGFVGHLSGWDILVSNNVATTGTGAELVYYPLFGRKGKTLAGGISADLNMQHYIPEKSFDTTYKGYGLFGVGAPRADYLGTVKISAPLSIS